MNRLIDIFQQKRCDMENALIACSDAKEAGDTAAFWIQKIKDEYIYLYLDDIAYNRSRINALFTVALCAVGAISSVTQTEISMKIQPVEAPPSTPRIRSWRDLWAYRPYIAAALSGFLCVWLFMEDMTNPAVLALLAAVVSLSSKKSEPAAALVPPTVTGVPKVDVAELMRRLERLMIDMDEAMENREECAVPVAALTKDTLEAVQMLIEAHLTNDGAFALKTVPRMADALKHQGIELMMYSGENKQYFDLYPAQEEGETIRPALRLGDEVLMRGQATIRA